jgi:hypothetical protein
MRLGLYFDLILRLMNYYLTSIATNVEATKSILTTIVVANRNFSNPRRVWYREPPSPPPKTPPTPAFVCWSKTEAVKIIDSIICIYGNSLAIVVIGIYYYICPNNANKKALSV